MHMRVHLSHTHSQVAAVSTHTAVLAASSQRLFSLLLQLLPTTAAHYAHNKPLLHH
jgi:hypothetical protein